MLGKSGRDFADHGHSVPGQAEGRGGDDRKDDDDQRRGNLGRQPTCDQQQGQAHTAHQHGRPTHLIDLRDDFRDLARRCLGPDAEPEYLTELADDDDDGDAVQVTDQHGPREIVRDPAQPGEQGNDIGDPDQQGQQGSQRGALHGVRGHRDQRRPDHCGDRPFRADDHLPGRAEDRIGNRGQQQRVQADHR